MCLVIAPCEWNGRSLGPFFKTSFDSCQPYLLSIGYSQATTALVWLLGPLSGAFLQPYLAVLSDNSKLRWGRRKPFMVAGISGAVISMVALSLVRVMASRAFEWFMHRYVEPHTMTLIAQRFSVFWLCLLNISLQPLQIGLRALVVDSCPSHQQRAASAWCGRFASLGAITTYLLDNWLVQRYPNRSFEVLSLLTSINLVFAMLPGLIVIEEKTVAASFQSASMLATFRKALRKMPKAARHICIVQFTSWLGWFPFLYYTTT